MVPEIIHIPPPPPQKLTGNSQQGVGGAVWNVKQGIKIFQGGEGGDRFKRKKKDHPSSRRYNHHHGLHTTMMIMYTESLDYKFMPKKSNPEHG